MGLLQLAVTWYTLEGKLPTGTSKTKKIQIYLDEVALFWMSHWAACPPAKMKLFYCPFCCCQVNKTLTSCCRLTLENIRQEIKKKIKKAVCQVPGTVCVEGRPGPRGFKGTQGNNRHAGREKGEQGYDGFTGPAGATGEPGDPGINGLGGPKGDIGEPGYPGLDGARGPKGTQGDPGNPGLPGMIKGKSEEGLRLSLTYVYIHHQIIMMMMMMTTMMKNTVHSVSDDR